jgi:hypothetical protein
MYIQCNSEKQAQKEKHCGSWVNGYRRCLGRLCMYFLYWRWVSIATCWIAAGHYACGVIYCIYCVLLKLCGGGGVARWPSWLRHCATSRKVAGPIPDYIFGIFPWYNPSGRTMTLELSRPLTEISTRNISWGVKAADAWGWRNLPLSYADCLKICEPQTYENPLDQ